MTDRYTLLADCHVGADLHTYRDYLESSYHDDFDAWAADFLNPWRTSPTSRRSAMGQRGATSAT